jgi:mono/diheme cytochrome c family protein
VNANRLFLIVSLLLFALLVIVARAELDRPWRAYQEGYYGQLAQVKGLLEDQIPSARIIQDWVPELNRTDRCRTCHVGVENPEMWEAPLPYTTHSGDLLEYHPVEVFGCTVCHEGEGRGTTVAGAHGELARSQVPLLEGAFIEASCGKCHFDPELDGAPSLTRGTDLYRGYFCSFCHRIGDSGGDVGPDLTRVGSKPVFQFDFRNVEGRATVALWLMEHFRDPSRVSPGTQMPDYRLADEDIRDLTVYMLSLTGEDLPAKYRLPPLPLEEEEIIAASPGEELYLEACAVCHGPDGEGRRHFAPMLNDQDFLAIASDDFLNKSIAVGRPGSAMFTWHEDLGGVFSSERIQQLVDFIRSWQRVPSKKLTTGPIVGEATRGRLLFSQICADCHGEEGEGYLGPALNNVGFLDAASDGFTKQIIVSARQGDPIRACLEGSEEVEYLSERDIDDVVAFIRSWE